MTMAPAWILPLNETTAVSVGEFELVHTLTDLPSLFSIPKAPYYCQHVMLWQNNIVPVMNLAARFLPISSYTESDYENDIHRLGALSIFAYQSEQTKQIDYGALLLHSVPQHCEVRDSQQCELPADLVSWKYYFTSCFQVPNSHKVIPILCLERLFGIPSR
ncbi:MAG: hypothetical protein WAX77_01245 [Methylococcaceae bacterium]